jgi:N-methylhydantoinase B
LTAVDGATVEVIRNYLVSVAEQMRRSLVRTAFSPVIYDILDFGISIYDGQLRLMAETAGGAPFLGANDYSIRKIVDYIGVERFEPGDAVLLNYPYWSAAHAYDAVLTAPVFETGTRLPIAYLCVRGHWMDLGAKDPGYVLDSTSVHQEGLMFPGTKIVKGGVIDEELLELIRYNSRMPESVIGDFHAQLTAIRTGERRLHQIYEKFGRPAVEEAVTRILDHGEQQALRALRSLPHGSWTAVDWLDDDGVTDRMIRMQVTITIDDDNFTADFSGSERAVPGPVNMPYGATHGMVKTVFKALTTPHEPRNGGHLRPVRTVAPPGTLFHAIYPAATFTLWTQMVALELLHKALAQGVASIAASSGGDEPGFMAVGVHPDGRTWVISNNEGIGWGGTPDHDGANAQQHLIVNVIRNTPIEILESKTPLFHHRLELRTDSGGPGRYRGGLGVRRDVSYLAEGEVLSMKKKTKTRPWALHGGFEPDPSAIVLWPGTPRERVVGYGGNYISMFRAQMAPQEGFTNLSAGGAGFGNPLERDPTAVVHDVSEGYVSPEAARRDYGVIVNDDGTWQPAEGRAAAIPMEASAGKVAPDSAHTKVK